MLDKIPASHDDHEKWHWAEGNKYAIEGIKTLLLLNGGSAVALLAFIGNWKEGPRPSIGSALLWFGAGALCAAVAFIGAYMTQLNYGSRRQSIAERWHRITYLLILLSAVAFGLGLFFPWRNLAI